MDKDKKWEALSMRDRAFLIRQAVRNGITDINSIKNLYVESQQGIKLGVPYKTFEAGSDYDYYNAAPENMPAKNSTHWTSRNPHTGQLLKSPNHPTYDMMIDGERGAGFKIEQIGDREYSFPIEHRFDGEENQTVEGSLGYQHKFSGEEDLSQIINSFSNTNTSPSEEYLKKMTESSIPLRSNFEDASHYEQDFYNQKISGLRDITKDVTSGQGYLYNHNLIPHGNVIKAKDKPFYYLVRDDVQSYLPLDMYEVLYNQDPKSYGTFRKELPKRNYIGGKTSKITREKTAKLIPGFIDSIVAISKRHHINPEVLYHRISKEGYLDKEAWKYNYEGTVKDQKQYWQNVPNREVNGFMEFGLDDAGSLLKEGKIKLTKPVSWEEIDATNEKNRDVISVVTPTVWDALEIKAGDLRRRQDIMKKMGFKGKDLDTWTNASYNLGVSHKDLKNRKYIERNYTIPDYSHFIKK